MAMDDKEFLKVFSPPTDEDRAEGLVLLPQHVRDVLPRTRQCGDNVRRVKLYSPWNDGAYAGWCWHVISVDDADDNVAFCYVEGIANEYGAVRLDRIASIRGPGGQRVIREPVSSMPRESVEACLNVWCIVDEGTRFVYRIAARAYALECPDHEKSDVLKRLSFSDFHLARELPVLSKYRTTITDDDGRKLSATGLFPADVHVWFPDIFDMVCKELEREFPERPVVGVDNLRSYKMKFTADPYHVLTFLRENAKGELSPAPA